MEIQKNNYLNRGIVCNLIENQKTKETTRIENPAVVPMDGTEQPDSHLCKILSTKFDRETSRLTLEIESEGSETAFFSYYWFSQKPSPKGVVFVLAPKDGDFQPSPKKQIQVTIDLNDPKYASFLDRFTRDEFKIRFIDSEDQFIDQILVKPPGAHRSPNRYTTMAVGEEGQDGGFLRPRPEITTKAIGEEGQDAGWPHPIQHLPNRENGMTTLALGEEGQENPPSLISHAFGKVMGAIGSVIDQLTPKNSGPGFTTLALGEEGQDSSIQIKKGE